MKHLRFKDDSGNDFSDWKVQPLGKMVELINGLTYSPNNIREKGMLVLRSSNVQNSKICLQDNVYVDLPLESEKKTQINDIVLCVRNGSRRLIGKSAIVDKPLENTTHGAFMALLRGSHNQFVFQLLQTRLFFREVHKNLGATINSINGSDLKKMKFISPTSIEEQQKIAAFLGAVDEKIAQLQKKKDLLEDYKKGCMQKLFSQEIRFTDDNGNPFSDWEEKKLGELLDYSQPTEFLVSSTEYSDDYKTPVLTAGKTFILGYTNETHGIFKDALPTIIFDDFTTAFHYVDFPFKAKSSAMKMLTIKNSMDNIRYIHAAMTQIKFALGEHKRYWIAEYQNEKVSYPHPDEQKKIAGFLSAIDDKIALVAEELDKAKTFKKGLLQQMFV